MKPSYVTVELLQRAHVIVKGSPLYRKFIDGTPLENDIAVWMADFAGQVLHDAESSVHPRTEPNEPVVVPLDDPTVPESLVPIEDAASLAQPDIARKLRNLARLGLSANEICNHLDDFADKIDQAAAQKDQS